MNTTDDRRVLALTGSRLRRLLALLLLLGGGAFLVFERHLFYYAQKGFQLSYYLTGFVLVLLTALLTALKLQLPPAAEKPVSLLCAAACVPCLLAMMETFDVNPISAILDNALLFNLWMILLLIWIVYSLCGRFSLAVRIAAVPLYILGLANSAVRLFRGTPLSALDLLNVKTAAAVAGRYHYTFPFYFFIATLWLLFVWALAGKATWRVRAKAPRWIARGACLAVTIVFCAVFSNTALLNALDIKDFLWNQNLAFGDNGLLLSFAYSTKYLHVDVPEDYSAEAVSEIMDGVEPQSATSDVKPNLIVIMDESLSDLSVVGDFDTDADYMPFLHSLRGADNAITGQMRVSTFGGGTCNTEFEFLTGCTLGFFPYGSVVYQHYINRSLPSLATVLQAQGYTADAVHPFYSYCWNREKVYPLLGFEHFYDLTSFYDARMIGSYASNCVSDESDFAKLIDLYENKAEGKPMFLFNVTMQNHGGYAQLINAPDEMIHFSKDGYTSVDADNYLSLVKATDTAFAGLIDYFSKVEEPTIILLFGDHEPNLPDSVYETLLGTDLDELTQEQLQQRYTVPFFLWANYDIEGDGDAGITSANYLSTLLLQTAGLQTTPYMQFLSGLSQKIPALSLYGYRGDDGKEYRLDDESDYTDLIAQYRTLQYNYLFDKKDRQDLFFTVAAD